jgi:hypothetical protein
VINHLELWERIVAPLCDAPGVYALPLNRASQRSELPREDYGGEVEYSSGGVWAKRGSIAVQAVERQNDRAMLVSWSDATRGRFADQRWVSAKSRCAGRCVLTGGVIRRGDPVYKPQRRGPSRTAIGAGMILAVALERLAETEVTI